MDLFLCSVSGSELLLNELSGNLRKSCLPLQALTRLWTRKHFYAKAFHVIFHSKQRNQLKHASKEWKPAWKHLKETNLYTQQKENDPSNHFIWQKEQTLQQNKQTKIADRPPILAPFYGLQEERAQAAWGSYWPAGSDTFFEIKPVGPKIPGTPQNPVWYSK